MPHLQTDASSSGPYWGVEEKTVSVLAPLMIGTAVSNNFGILAFAGNPVSHVQADGNDNMSSVLTG